MFYRGLVLDKHMRSINFNNINLKRILLKFFYKKPTNLSYLVLNKNLLIDKIFKRNYNSIKIIYN